MPNIQNAFDAGEGILRLAPNWVSRSFCIPGRRIKLHPDDYYALGSARGGIDERWFASTTKAENGPLTTEHEGMSMVVAADGEFLLADAVQELKGQLIGDRLWNEYHGWPMFSKFFDNLGPLPHHVHHMDRHAALVGQRGKPEAYYFPPQLNNHGGHFPFTFFGFEPGTTREEVRRCLEIVEGRAKVLQDLITSFYDLSRIEGGEYPLELQAVDLRRALEPLLAGFYEDFQQAGFQVSVELAENLPLVQADPGAVTRILTNLIGNALKHGSKTLDIRLYQEGEALVTSFSNDAPDLTQEDLPRVFERFYTADQMRTGQNTGLGLAIVKALAERMGHAAFAQLRDGVFTVGVRWKASP